ncbi:MAG: hypothetical protein N2321_00020 [Melioribacteraceae bacterium]|nr:hypothetical protein [Melioribacteraceae bacterium]
MRRIFFIILIIQTLLFAQEKQLKNFDELFYALKNGKHVKVVVEYEKAKLLVDGKEEKAPNAIGGFDLKSFEYFAKGVVRNEKSFISISESVLIYHPRYNYVINYVKIRIYDDNKVEIIARYLDPKTYEIKMDETFYAEINNYENNQAVYFYISNEKN